MPAHFALRFAVVALALMLAGCGCGKEKKEDLTKPPAPLEERSVPSSIKVAVYPQKGATSLRPVVMVVAKDPSYCDMVREQYRTVGHVLCGDGTLATVEPELKAGAAYLKKTYPRYVARAPVHLFVDEARAEVGWRLMLKEPGFFSHAFLPGLKESALTNITLHALSSRGAETLVLSLDDSKRLKFLTEVAKRSGLSVRPLGNKADTRKRAIETLKAADLRLTAQPASKK